jgi:hypothetical protein
MNREALFDELERIFDAAQAKCPGAKGHRVGIKAVFYACRGRKRTKGPRINPRVAATRLASIVEKRASVECVLGASASVFGASIRTIVDEMQSQRRWMIVWALRQFEVSYPDCAGFVGYKNHTSAMYGERQVQGNDGLRMTAVGIVGLALKMRERKAA